MVDIIENKDALIGIKTLPDESVDLIIADPHMVWAKITGMIPIRNRNPSF